MANEDDQDHERSTGDHRDEMENRQAEIEARTRRGCLWFFVVVVLVGVVLGVAISMGEGGGGEEPDVDFAREMCDTNEGGYYHYDEECMRRYLGP